MRPKSSSRIPKGQAFVEILASMDTIKDMIERGYNLKNIFMKLKDEEKATMAYQTFLYHMRRVVPKKQNSLSLYRAQPESSKSPMLESGKRRPVFDHNPMADIKDLI